MKINDMRITPVAVYDPPLRNSVGVHQPFALRTIVQLTTDDGLTGLAETYGGQDIVQRLEEVRSKIIGFDPYCVEALWIHTKAPRIHAPLEIACLDIVGKKIGRPVYDLLGGKVREQIPFSAYLFFKYQGEDDRDDWGEVLTPEAMLEEAQRFVQTWGFRTLKLKGGVLPPEEEIETMRLLRKAFPQHMLRLDPNAIWSVSTSIDVGRALEPLNIEYLEDPTEGQDGMTEVRKNVRIPLSTNMCVTTFEHIAEGYSWGCVDFVLADHHYWGGMHATKHLGAICQALGWELSMHSNTHLGISLAAMLHTAAATPQLKYACDTHYPWQKEDVIRGAPFQFRDGSLDVPDKPGLGVEIDEERLAVLHDQYLRVGIERRDDVSEMRKYDHTWEPKKPRW